MLRWGYRHRDRPAARWVRFGLLVSGMPPVIAGISKEKAESRLSRGMGSVGIEDPSASSGP
jgi:hypothetical protein